MTQNLVGLLQTFHLVVVSLRFRRKRLRRRHIEIELLFRRELELIQIVFLEEGEG